MPVALSLGDIVEVRLTSTGVNDRAVNVLHGVIEAPVGVSLTLQELADQINAAFVALLPPCMSVHATFRGVTASRVFPLPRSVSAVSSAAGTAGAVAGDPLPAQCSGVIAKKTVLAGKHFRGRFYVPYPAESQSGADGQPNAGYVALLDLLKVQLTGTVPYNVGANALDFTNVVLRRDLPLGLAATNKVDATVSRILWGTQRRRGGFASHN